MKLLFAILTLLFCLGFSFSQDGYLGHQNTLELEINLSPASMVKQSINSDQTISTQRKSWLNTIYKANYSRTISKKLKLSMGYSFTQSQLNSFEADFIKSDTVFHDNGVVDINKTTLIYVEDPKFNFHEFNLELNYFRSGNIAPIGKYLGIGISFGFTSPIGEVVVGNRLEEIKSNFFRTQYEIDDVVTARLPEEKRVFQVQLYPKIGRVYPISKRLLLNYNLSIPLITVLATDDLLVTARNVDYDSENSNFNRLFMHSVRQLEYLSFGIGLQYAF